MEAFGGFVAEDFHGAQADLEMAVDLGAVEIRGHAGELQLAMQRLVGDAEQRAVGDAEAEAVGGDGGALHVQRHGARLAELAHDFGLVAQFPVAVVESGYGAGSHDLLGFNAGGVGNFLDRLLKRHLHFGKRGDGHGQRQVGVEHVILAHIGAGQHIIAQLLGIAQAGAVAQHDPGVGAQHRNMIGDGFGVGGTDPDIDHGDAAATIGRQVVGGHLRRADRGGAGDIAAAQGVVGDDVPRLDEAGVMGVPAGQVLLGDAAEFVDVEGVVGEDDEVLEMGRVGAGIVAQPEQRVIDARGGERR